MTEQIRRQPMANDPLAQKMKKRLDALAIVAFGAAVTTIAFPVLHKLQIALCSLLPICALLVIRSSKGSISLIGNFNEMVKVLAPFALCLVALVQRAFYDAYILSYTAFLIPFGIFAVFFFFFITWADRSPEMNELNTSNKAAVTILAVVSLVFAFGFVGSLNTTFDLSKPETFSVKVLDTDYTISYSSNDDDFGSSRSETKTYYLTLDTWGPQTEVKEIEVYPSLYSAVSVGDHVTVKLYKGLFRVPNYRLEQQFIHLRD